jgi:hypothetical protein
MQAAGVTRVLVPFSEAADHTAQSLIAELRQQGRSFAVEAT